MWDKLYFVISSLFFQTCTPDSILGDSAPSARLPLSHEDLNNPFIRDQTLINLPLINITNEVPLEELEFRLKDLVENASLLLIFYDTTFVGRQLLAGKYHFTVDSLNQVCELSGDSSSMLCTEKDCEFELVSPSMNLDLADLSLIKFHCWERRLCQSCQGSSCPQIDHFHLTADSQTVPSVNCRLSGAIKKESQVWGCHYNFSELIGVRTFSSMGCIGLDQELAGGDEKTSCTYDDVSQTHQCTCLADNCNDPAKFVDDGWTYIHQNKELFHALRQLQRHVEREVGQKCAK